MFEFFPKCLENIGIRTMILGNWIPGFTGFKLMENKQQLWAIFQVFKFKQN